MAKVTRKKYGLTPGAIVFTGQRKVDKIDIHYLAFNSDDFSEKELTNQSMPSVDKLEENTTTWYDFRGIHDEELIQTVGAEFSVHPLALEDIADTQKRPKFEEFDEGIFIVFKALSFNKETKKVVKEQVSIFMGESFVLSFQEDETDLFLAVRNRLRTNKGRIRRKSADYLLFALIDLVMDNYYLVLDGLELCIEELEVKILSSSSPTVKAEIHDLKQEMISIRKAIAPLREAIGQLTRTEHEFVQDGNKLYFRNLYDHNIQLLDTAETYRDILTSLHDLYLSEISFRMNQVMQILTLITTIFVPLSFLVGLYGMNFEYIPELKFKYGYFVLLGLMGTLAVSLLLWFKRKGWF